MITEQMPKLVEEQVKAISNLKIDQVTVWETGAHGERQDQTADFLSGLVGSLPPLHELADERRRQAARVPGQGRRLPHPGRPAEPAGR